MTLLEAVNLCLRSTGEAGVAAIVTNHPKFETILASIDTASKREQRRGRWFNTAVRTLEPTVGGPNDGKVSVVGYDQVIPTLRGLDGHLFPRGDFLYDPHQDTEVLDRSVQAKVRWIYDTTAEDWLLMPASFTDYVGNVGALEYAGNYDAEPAKLSALKLAVQEAYKVQNTDHIRYSRTNLFWSGSAGPALQNAFGDRYVITRNMR